MKKKLLALLLCAALLLAALAGCANAPAADEPTEAPASETPTEAPAATEEPAAEGVYTPGVYTAAAAGRNGDVTVEVEFSADAIVSVSVREHTETAGIADPALERIPAAIVDGQTLAVATVSGATMTSEAILNAVADCVKQAGGDPEALQNASAGETAGEAEEYTVDVAVVGAGGAGLFGALEAARAGASVLVLEKSATCLASNSNQIGGTCAVESRMTKSIGETYTADDL